MKQCRYYFWSWIFAVKYFLFTYFVKSTLPAQKLTTYPNKRRTPCFIFEGEQISMSEKCECIKDSIPRAEVSLFSAISVSSRRRRIIWPAVASGRSVNFTTGPEHCFAVHSSIFFYFPPKPLIYDWLFWPCFGYVLAEHLVMCVFCGGFLSFSPRFFVEKRWTIWDKDLWNILKQELISSFWCLEPKKNSPWLKIMIDPFWLFQNIFYVKCMLLQKHQRNAVCIFLVDVTQWTIHNITKSQIETVCFIFRFFDVSGHCVVVFLSWWVSFGLCFFYTNK